MIYKFYIFFILFLLCCDNNSGYSIEVETFEKKENQINVEILVQQKINYYTSDYANVGWTTTPCLYSDEYPTAVVYKNNCFSGLTFNCENIFVADRGPLYKSALVHEFGHCYRLHLGMDGDALHEDGQWWDKIREVNLEIKNNQW